MKWLLNGFSAEQGLRQHRWIAYKFLSQIEHCEEAKRSLVHEEFDTTLNLLNTRIPNNVKEVKIMKTTGSLMYADQAQ